MKRIFSSVMIIGILLGCSEPVEEIYSGFKQVEENIVALTGGTLVTSDSLILIVPPGALPLDGLVFLGKTGNEPRAVPNRNIHVEGDPITLRLPVSSLLKPVELKIPLLSNFIDTTKYFILLFNGSSYFPMKYALQGNQLLVTIDNIDWETTGSKNSLFVSEFIILFASYKQSIPEKEMGLKKVVINSETEEISYATPAAHSSSKVLLLVHGWTGSPEKWNDFLPWLMSDKELPYTEYWTFGYNSSRSIDQNGELLFEHLKTHSNGAQIDIVAHSMGGLVSRSMIENHEGAPYIHKLITLGSPHKGSPLAVFRYALGALVAENNPDATMAYNYNTQGFRDLDASSAFIQEMKKLDDPPLPYFTIAATNNPQQNLFSQISSNQILEGPDDGIVSVASAHGVRGAVSADDDIYIPTGWAHIKMLADSTVYNETVRFLYLHD